jgi:hypothetical protein
MPEMPSACMQKSLLWQVVQSQAHLNGCDGGQFVHLLEVFLDAGGLDRQDIFISGSQLECLQSACQPVHAKKGVEMGSHSINPACMYRDPKFIKTPVVCKRLALPRVQTLLGQEPCCCKCLGA